MNKENKSYHIIAGLPRSGSTLLANILNQNPRFHASETSGLSRVLAEVKRGWENIIEIKSNYNIDIKRNVLKSIVDGYYLHQDKEVIFDKNRAWVGEAFLAKEVFGEDVKFILCVRDLPEILASFENLYRKQDGYFDLLDKKSFPEKFRTLEGRLELWASTEGPVGSPLLAIKELTYKAKKVLFVDFDYLTKFPEATMKEIYEFIGEEYYEHDFENVIQTTSEEDLLHGILHLHDVRESVKPIPHKALNVLGETLFKKYSGAEFWKR